MPETRKNTSAGRYEILEGGRVVGHVDYRDLGHGVIELPHTEVDADKEGKGVASALVKFALNDIRASGASVKPSCSYVAGYLDRHPELADLRADST